MNQEHAVVYDQRALEQAQQLDNGDYLRMLDALGRFYNSQVTQHVGYLITSVLGYVALFSLAIQSKWIQLPYEYLGFPLDLLGWYAVLLFVVLGFICVIMPYPPFPLYFLSRVQYYIALSEVVWDHMGMTNSDLAHRDELKVRVFQRMTQPKYPGTHGLIQAVMSLFEAQLYLSCRPESHHGSEWKRDFVISDELAKYLSPDTSRIGVWKFKVSVTCLLRIAYRSRIRDYLNAAKGAGNEESEDYRKGKLFSECSDC
jgi:hypothetical protein